MCVDLIKLTIDGKEVEVPAGTSVLDAAENIGIHIPRLCYDPCLSSVGACRICVVEIDGIRNLPASCVTTVTPGMVVRTEHTGGDRGPENHSRTVELPTIRWTA